MDNSEDLELQQAELESLKARADLLGVSYHPSIGADKLRAKIAEATANREDQTSNEEVKVEEETIAQRRLRKKREASELVRIRVTCMNPAKNEWEGEIITAGNSLVGTFKKFVPFNAEDGWHVPRIIYNQLKNRQCQVFTTVKDSRGNKVRKGKLIKEFAIEELPPLSAIELKELAQVQAMKRSVD